MKKQRRMNAILTKAVQEFKSENDALNDEVSALKEKVKDHDAMKDQIDALQQSLLEIQTLLQNYGIMEN